MADITIPETIALALVLGAPLVSPAVPATIPLELTVAAGAGLLVDSAARNPAALVTVTPQKLRATAPANLGDDDFSTVQGPDGPAPGAGTTFNAIAATAIQQTATIPDPGPISHVVVYAAGQIRQTGGDPDITESRIKIAIGGSDATHVCTGDWGVKLGASGGFYGTIETPAIATKPGGGAWTWADVNAISEIRPEIEVASGLTLGSSNFVGEIWVEVHRPNGSAPDIVRRKARLGAVRRTTSIGA